MHESAPVVHMYRIHLHQPYVTVDTGAGIPAGVRLLAIIRLHYNYVRLASIPQIRRQVITKRYITIRAESQRMTIDPNLAIPVNPVEININNLTPIRLRKGKCLSIPANPAR